MTGEDYKNGQLILIDKPLEWTSFQVVNKVRWLIRKQFDIKKIKVGHAGTLDPLATGLLILCSGKFTKKIDTYQAQEKEYTGTFTLGATTPSYDLETEIDQQFDISGITSDKIKMAVQQFIGEIQQQPPVFSALKKDGKRLYEFARAGEEVEIPMRTVSITAFEITNIDLPNIDFRVVCSKGTYIRSLANDFGKALDNGAHLSALRRTKIGDFSVDDAVSMETFETTLKATSL
jgi:tRNA pseudouridine55 synthase